MALFAMSSADWLASALVVGGPASLGFLVGIEVGRPGAGMLAGLAAGVVVVTLFGWRRHRGSE